MPSTRTVVELQPLDLSNDRRFLARGRVHRQVASHSKLHHVLYVANDGGQRQADHTIDDANLAVGMGQADNREDWKQ